MLKHNLIANYLGQGWRAIMALAFVPLYVKYLSVEAYGLIGIFAILQAWLGLLDLGLRPALLREMARYTGGAYQVQRIWNLLRSIEIVALAVAVIVASGVWAVSQWLATDWVQAGQLSRTTVAQAFTLMGVVVGLQFIESVYTSSLAGLQRQVLQNVILATAATLRGLGSVFVLGWVSPTLQAFFIWQALVSVFSLAIFVFAVYGVLPTPPRRPQFSKTALLDVWRFAAGMSGIALLALLLTQVDKMLLSRLLPLKMFGYYTLASVVAGGLYMFTSPIASAFLPRFTELHTRNDIAALTLAYHLGSQLVTVLMGSAAAVLIVFAERILLLWTADTVLAKEVAPLMQVLALGTLLHGLMWIPYQMQLAYGWTSLAIRTNIIAVSVLVPAILWLVPLYGAMSAAWIWVALNSAYVLVGVHFMYRRILKTEKWAWYHTDVVLPLSAAFVVALLCKIFFSVQYGRWGELFVVGASSVLVLCVAGVVAPMVRVKIKSLAYSRLGFGDS